jgi:DNA-binding LacI/PurR family transcriptional regulator
LIKRATIKNVADHAGVSIATVSRIVNGHSTVGEKVREHVTKSIKVLKFRPNVIGRNLKTSRTHVFGIVVPTLSNPVFAEMVGGIQEEARLAGYSTLVTMNEYQEGEEEMAVETMLNNRVEGLILTVADADNSLLCDRLDDEDIPYVLLYNKPETSKRCAVAVDNVAGGARAAEEFVKFGHTRSAVIAGRFSDSDRSQARYEGFSNYFKSEGLPPPLLTEVDFSKANVKVAIAELLSHPNPPTAIFCSTDIIAISVIGIITSLGLSVPGDISVIGFDGIDFGQLIQPSLTTISQPSRRMGRVAVQLLMDRIEGGEETLRLMPFRFCAGESVTRVKQIEVEILA